MGFSFFLLLQVVAWISCNNLYSIGVLGIRMGLSFFLWPQVVAWISCNYLYSISVLGIKMGFSFFLLKQVVAWISCNNSYSIGVLGIKMGFSLFLFATGGGRCFGSREGVGDKVCWRNKSCNCSFVPQTANWCAESWTWWLYINRTEATLGCSQGCRIWGEVTVDPCALSW